LLDENLPRQIKNLFSDNFDVTTVPDLGWQSKKNGELLIAMAEIGIDYLLTADKNLRFQQNLDSHSVKIVVLLTHDTRRKFLEKLC
jgi:predicted nuclease of predicted toxin-antitoxin system